MQNTEREKNTNKAGYITVVKPNLKQTALKGFGWVFMGTLGQNLLQFISLIVLARLISPGEFGIVAMAMFVINFLKIFAELGVGPALVQKKELTVLDIKTANLLSLLLSVLMGGVVYLSSRQLSLFFNMPDLENIINALAFMLPIIGLSVVGQSLLQRNLKFKEIAYYNLLSYFIAHAMIAIPLALFGYGLWSLVVAYLGQIITIFVIVRIKVRETNMYGFDFLSAKALLNFGFGFSIARVSNFLAGEGDNLIIGKFLGAEALGFYGRAYQLMSMPAMLFGSALDKVLFPLMSNIQDENERLSRVYVSAISTVAMFMLPLSALLFLLANEIITLVLGEQWNNITPIFQILSIVLVFRMSYKFSDSVARAKGAVYRRAWRQILYALFVFIFAWIGHFYGLQGVASGIAIAIFLNFLLMLQLSKSLIGFRWVDILRTHSKHIVITATIFIIMDFIKSFIVIYTSNVVIIFIFNFILFILITLGIWWLFRKYLKQEIMVLQPFVAKIITLIKGRK